ncbi:MAG: aldehyde ferredoxin oxidoreductase C-terminal domain-containing protein [Chloroflexota bacterium]|nr:aldehyde ferredoxin oxidoreductase C-terminal domain-containing protein [Chloroflexota bacterium]
MDIGSLLRVNMTTASTTRQPVPEAWSLLGGRGLVAHIALDEIPPLCEPLGPGNRLLILNGPLAATPVPCSGRLSVGGKSPLTGGIKEANSGGVCGHLLARLGLRAIIVAGQPTDEHWYLLHVRADGAEILPADDLVGLGTYATVARLRERFGGQIGCLVIGPAGEMRMSAAGVANTDVEGRPSRFSARGGMGALMGSRHLKAIVIESARRNAPLADRGRFMAAVRQFIQHIKETPQTAEVYPTYSTAAMVMPAETIGFLPTRGFSAGRFEKATPISGEALHDAIIERGGEGNTTHACMPGCIIRCSNIWPNLNGRELVSPLEYETIALMGSNLGLGDLDEIARLNRMCNDIGIDTIETGAALGVAVQAGLAEFDDAGTFAHLLDEIRDGTPLGRILGNGAAFVGRAYGISRVPAVKGQAMAGYDPRAIKGTGVTFATCPQGADHTAGHTARAKINHQSPTGQVKISHTVQVTVAALDSLGLCLMTAPAVGGRRETLAELVSARFGVEWTAEDVTKLGQETIRLEREFNRRAGFTAADDRIPEWMGREPLPPHGTIFDVPGEEIDQIYDFE